MTELENVLQAIAEEQKKLGDGPAFWVAEQLKDILREAPAAAPIVLEDLAAGQTVAACEKKIHDYAKTHKGCCPPKEADRIIREFFGIQAVESRAAAPAGQPPARRAISLTDFL